MWTSSINRDHLAGRFLDFFEHGLEPFLEFAAELCARHQRAHVERDDAPVLEALGHVARDDPLGESLDDRGFADARLADQDGIVLGPPREHLDDAANLLVAADHRIEFAAGRHRGQIASVALQRLIGRLGIGGGHPLITAHLLERAHQLVVRQPGLAQNFGAGAGLVERGDQHMLDRGVFVFELGGFLLGAREHAAQALGHVDLAGIRAASGYARQLVDFVLELADDRGAIDTGELENRSSKALLVIEQRGQQMLDVNGLMMGAERSALRPPHRLLQLFGKAVRVHQPER